MQSISISRSSTGKTFSVFGALPFKLAISDLSSNSLEIFLKIFLRFKLSNSSEAVSAISSFASAPKLTKGQYFIQVIALSNQNRAQGIVDKMKKAGVPAYLSPIQAKSGRIYRVQAGPFKSAKIGRASCRERVCQYV